MSTEAIVKRKHTSYKIDESGFRKPGNRAICYQWNNFNCVSLHEKRSFFHLVYFVNISDKRQNTTFAFLNSDLNKREVRSFLKMKISAGFHGKQLKK